MSETRKFLTEPEIEAFFKAARKTRNGVRDHCMAMMAYRHGFRVSELIDIRLDEVHLDMARLDVRRLKKGLNGHHPIEGDELRAIRAWMKAVQSLLEPSDIKPGHVQVDFIKSNVDQFAYSEAMTIGHHRHAVITDSVSSFP